MIETFVKTNYGKVRIDFLGKKFTSNIAQLDWNQWIKESLSNHYSIERDLIFSANQVHGDAIVNTSSIDSLFKQLNPLKKESQLEDLSKLNADAIYSTNANEVLVVRTADCVPIAVWAYEFPFVCMVHSGWKGTYLQILEKAYKLLLDESLKFGFEFPKVGFAIGPRIFGKNYEVEIDVASHFLSTNGILDSYLSEDSNIQKYKLDLGVIVKDQIKKFKPNAIVMDFSVNTFNSSDWFSHRAGEIGRNLNTITITT